MTVEQMMAFLSECNPKDTVLIGGYDHAHSRDSLSNVNIKQEPIHRDSMGYALPVSETRPSNSRAVVLRRTV